MVSRSTILALAFTATTLAGCGDYRGVESAHQPVVSRSDYALDLATSGYGLAPGEDARLAGWFASMRVGYGDSISLDDPPTPAARATPSPRRRLAVACCYPTTRRSPPARLPRAPCA